MATEAPTLDPRIEEVLRDIAADPRARLFSCDVGKLARGIGHARIDASLSMAGLTSAERHLLTIGREEVARLFLIAFRERLEAEQDGSFVYSHNRMSASTWKLRAARSMRSPFEGQDEQIYARDTTIRGLLAACVTSAGQERVSRDVLLAASQRLADTPTVRIYVAINLAMQQRWISVAHAIGHLIQSACTPIEQFYAMQWRARTLENIEDLIAAGAAYWHAYEYGDRYENVRPHIRSSLLSGFVVAIRCGDLNEIDRYRVVLSQSLENRSIDAAVLSQLRAAAWPSSLSRNARTALASRIDRFSGTAKEILRVATR